MIGDLREQRTPFFRSLAGWCAVFFLLVAVLAGAGAWHNDSARFRPADMPMLLETGRTTGLTFTAPFSGPGEVALELHVSHTKPKPAFLLSHRRGDLPLDIRWELKRAGTALVGGSLTNNLSYAPGRGVASTRLGWFKPEKGERYNLLATVTGNALPDAVLGASLTVGPPLRRQMNVSVNRLVLTLGAFGAMVLSVVCAMSYQRYGC